MSNTDMKERFFAYVDERQRRYIDQLGEAVA
jgi:hypothetical protein